MNFVFLVLLGVGLSFDTFAVSVSCGLIDEKIRFLQAVRISLFFAFFQALMPILGYFLGYNVKEYIENIDHWLAFGLLSLLGIKMIWESLKSEDERDFDPHNLKVILSMSFATTIDAFIVGISLALISVNLVWSAVVIGMVTFLAAMLGMLFGKNIGSYFGKKVEILGGIILIGIGLKILLAHFF